MANRITPEQIEQINIWYKLIDVYSSVAEIVGVSAASVRKYVDPNFELEEPEITFAASELPEFDVAVFRSTENWGDLCVLSDEEWQEVEELRKELLV